MSKGTYLSSYPITHGGVKPVRHPELRTQIAGQTVVKYLRYRQPVRIDRLELPRTFYGRWVPAVPTHPAHLTVSVLDTADFRWRVVRDIDIPADPRLSGKGLGQKMSVDEVFARFQKIVQEPPLTVELGGLETDLLRVECDREHPVWPNHGECNGGRFHVPFGLLDPLKAWGTAPRKPASLPGYRALLRVGACQPRAPRGMDVVSHPWKVVFRGRKLSVGFSLRRPMLLHLGWDACDAERACQNRLHAGVGGLSGLFGGQSGPVLRTFAADLGANNWSGRVDVRGNRVAYRDLDCGLGLQLDAVFTVEPDALHLELRQSAPGVLPVLEAEAWRLVWDINAAMTGAAAVPTLQPGRNGHVQVPMFWAGDGVGSLRCECLDSSPENTYLQVESYRVGNRVTGGIVLGARPGPEACQTIPAGTVTSAWRWSVANFEPAQRPGAAKPGAAVRRHWGSTYSCYRPEFGGFSNNAISVNCHVNQHAPCEVVAFTRVPRRGPDPRAMFRFTIERALLDGGGYGYYRELYLDSDPVLVSAAGRLHQADPQAAWLRRIEPGFVAAVRRILATIGREGLAVCRELSGNTGSFRWSSNAMDVVGFGHIDAYVNAWTYRALRNATALLRDLDRRPLAARCRKAAARLRAAFGERLVNPETGWVAGWRSRDGRLHDAAYLWLNGPAIAFGLLPPRQARTALRRLEALRVKAGARDAHFGVPFNLLPIPEGDHMLPRIHGPMSPTFENYTDGAMGACGAPYYLRALSAYGFRKEARQIARDLAEGLELGHFDGGVGSGVEFYRWDGVPCGYEGSFGASFGVLYALAVEERVIRPPVPEWWPQNG